MSVYERRYEVHYDRRSHYTDSPEEVLRLADRAKDPDSVWVNEGYAEEQFVPGSSIQIEGTIYTRRTKGRVLLSSLQFFVERQRVQRMLELHRDALVDKAFEGVDPGRVIVLQPPRLHGRRN